MDICTMYFKDKKLKSKNQNASKKIKKKNLLPNLFFSDFGSFWFF